MAKRGHFRFGAKTAEDHAALRWYQKMLGRDALATLDHFLAEKEPAAKKKANDQLKSLIMALAPEKRKEKV